MGKSCSLKALFMSPSDTYPGRDDLAICRQGDSAGSRDPTESFLHLSVGYFAKAPKTP